MRECTQCGKEVLGRGESFHLELWNRLAYVEAERHFCSVPCLRLYVNGGLAEGAPGSLPAGDDPSDALLDNARPPEPPVDQPASAPVVMAADSVRALHDRIDTLGRLLNERIAARKGWAEAIRDEVKQIRADLKEHLANHIQYELPAGMSATGQFPAGQRFDEPGACPLCGEEIDPDNCTQSGGRVYCCPGCAHTYEAGQAPPPADHIECSRCGVPFQPDEDMHAIAIRDGLCKVCFKVLNPAT